MKLYTEEQVYKAMIIRENQRIGFTTIVIEHLTPIELPSDEEIREERLLQFPDTEYTNRANDRLAFYCGAKFVMKKIKGGNK